MPAPARRHPQALTAMLALALVLASCSLLTPLDGLSGGGDPDGTAGADGGQAGDGGLGEGGASADFTDERLEGQFGAGTFSGTRWAGDHVELAAGARAGDFVSRVFDASGGTPLKTLRWVPGAPYGKALPDQGMAETGYRASSFDMANNVLLVHFDGALVDSSPAANVLSGTALGGFAPAVFGSGLADTPTGYVHMPVTGSQSVFNFGTDSFSWSIWVKSATLCPGNAVYMGLENPGTGFRPHLWLGCSPIGGGAGAQGTLGDTFCSIRTTSNDCADVAGSRVLTDGAWHHMAIVKSGHAQATMRAYLDGVLQGTTQASFQDPLVFDDGVEFAIGAFSKGAFPADGLFDEVAVWRRALSAEEVLALYRRGAQRLSFQVRACDEPQCAGVPFAGPAGDPARGFVDPSSALRPPSGQPIGASGRFVQYKVHFESDDASQSPSLYGVTIAR